MSIQQELTLFLNQQGIQSVGFAHLEQEDINLLKQCNMDFGDCSYGISIAVKTIRCELLTKLQMPLPTPIFIITAL